MPRNLFLVGALALWCGHASAADFCPTVADSQNFGLQYQLQGSQQGTLQLLRSHAQTAYYNPANGVGEWWDFKQASHPNFYRVFSQQQRRIDYYTGDLRTLNIHVSQTEIESFAANNLRQQLTLVGDGACADSQRYQGDYQGVHYELLWSNSLQLPLSLSTRRNDRTQQWQATAVLSGEQITQQLQQWQQFTDTDYADIGDNETDPFLAQMINQGFVEHSEHAVYNSQGQPLQGAHQH